MRLFCSMMHVASMGVRRKTVSLCHRPLVFFIRSLSHDAGGDQNCISPVSLTAPNASA